MIDAQPAVQVCNDLDLKAICSRSLKSAQNLSAGDDVDLYSEDSDSGPRFADLLSRLDIQAIIWLLSVPILAQSQYIRQALLAGKHVLSEKPIADNLNVAQELINWYHENIDSKQISWSVAENFRYLKSLEYAREQIHRAGKLLQFSVKGYANIQPGGKYSETDWRKNPEHQGGFLLDGGIHRLAGLRFLLGPENSVSSLSAQTALLQRHLAPVDTVDAVLRTKSNATGTLSISFGTTFKGSEWAIACEGGSVIIRKSTVHTNFDGKENFTEIDDEGSGVTPEIRAWGEALVKGERNQR
ncbi:hypothetical protein ACLMJK_000672 [Lecanora helva]